MHKLVSEFQRLGHIFYDSSDVSRILGLDCGSRPIPEAPRSTYTNSRIAFFYDGWGFQDLRECAAGQKHFFPRKDHWYDRMPSSSVQPGYYWVRLSDPRYHADVRYSHNLTTKMLMEQGWEQTPPIIVATAVLLRLADTGEDLLRGDSCDCTRLRPIDDRAVISVFNGRFVDVQSEGAYCDGGGAKHENAWLSACQRYE